MPAPSTPRHVFKIRERLGGLTSWALGLGFVAACVFVWWVLTLNRIPGQVESRIIGINILPAPREMFSVDTIRTLWFDKELSRSAVVSLARVASGFGIAAAIVLPLGALMGSFTKVAAFFRPLEVAGGYLPVAALVPITLVWFGTGERQKVGFIAIATFVYLLPLVVRAFNDVDEVFLQTAETQGATRWQIVSRVLWPIALPEIYNALRLGFGVAWSWIILAEVVAAERGLGFIINTAQGRASNMGHVYLTLLTIVALAFFLDRLWVLGHEALFPYRRPRHG
jgi:NitT/TauT family transport system permease protein